MATQDTFANWLVDLLDLAGEDPTDTAGDFYATAQRQLVKSYHHVLNAHPFQFLRVYPPGAFRTVAPRTTGTVLATQGSTSITFSSAPAASVANYQIVISGDAAIYRISAHTAGAAAATLDIAFAGATIAAGTYTLFLQEYDLASTVRHLEALWDPETGWPIESREEKWIRERYPMPSAVWPPRYFARVQDLKVMFEGYPSKAARLEYSYTQVPSDPDDANVTILIPRNARAAVIHDALFWLYLAMNDSRADAAGVYAAALREDLIADDGRKRSTLGQGRVARGLYQ